MSGQVDGSVGRFICSWILLTNSLPSFVGRLSKALMEAWVVPSWLDVPHLPASTLGVMTSRVWTCALRVDTGNEGTGSGSACCMYTAATRRLAKTKSKGEPSWTHCQQSRPAHGRTALRLFAASLRSCSTTSRRVCSSAVSQGGGDAQAIFVAVGLQQTAGVLAP